MDEYGQGTALRSVRGIEVGLHQALASQRKGTLSMCHALPQNGGAHHSPKECKHTPRTVPGEEERSQAASPCS